eukprot:TRINITY_DN976_c0_g1_i22.p2 TRINITY_DN976_c0_g1~~TRINITY_DN976_c0_g1_i22.p2  ORF type:complete len:167 (-),score=42.19 TRINITY_DN976_c0_g1_i22:200-700(-)
MCIRDSSNTVPLMKFRFAFKHDIDPSTFMELLTTKRKLWDKELALYEDVASDDDWTLYRYIMRSPSCLSSPLYSVEKRMLFEDEGTFYGYYSSVPDNVLPLKKSYNRCNTVFGGTVLKKERGEYAYYSLSQVDAHVNGFVQSLVMRFIPQRTQEFYEKLKKTIYSL